MSKVRIIETYRSESEVEECDYQMAIEVVKLTSSSSKIIFKAHDGEPEDNNMGRNFSDCCSVGNLLEEAYNAGKNGEDWEFECVESDDI